MTGERCFVREADEKTEKSGRRKDRASRRRRRESDQEQEREGETPCLNGEL